MKKTGDSKAQNLQKLIDYCRARQKILEERAATLGVPAEYRVNR